MEVNKAPKGLIVDLITPLDDKGDIDDDGLDSLLKNVLPHADAVLLASPQMGEGSGLGLKAENRFTKKGYCLYSGKTTDLSLDKRRFSRKYEKDACAP